MTGTSWRNKLAGPLSVALLAAAWEIAARLAANEVLWPPLGATVKALGSILADPTGRSAVAATLGRGLAGFAISAVLGTVLGLAAGTWKPVARLTGPPLVVIRSTPVMAIILFAVLWFRTTSVPVFTAFLVVFPVVYANVKEGRDAATRRWSDLSRAYALPPILKVFRVELPALAPYVLAGFSTGLGIAWKAVVAAEILILPARAVGTGMQRAQLQLDTPALMAWTIMAVLLAGITDGLLRVVLRFKEGRR
jgi:NitT/TauT family transport system permease protein